MADFNKAFKYTVNNTEIYSNSNLQNDKDYIESDKKMFDNYSMYQNTNHRYKKNIDYKSKVEEIYDFQGISDGYGPGKNINFDDELTRGNFHTKPLDKLAETVNYNRYVYPNLQKCSNINDKTFLISTTQSCNPQVNYNAVFEIYGSSDRNYNRKSEKFYKK